MSPQSKFVVVVVIQEKSVPGEVRDINSRQQPHLFCFAEDFNTRRSPAHHVRRQDLKPPYTFSIFIMSPRLGMT